MQKGMSLIELMIALLIGLLLSAAIITVYMSNKKTFWDSEAAASLQENSRFAMKLITQDLRMAGYYGGVSYKVVNKKTVVDLSDTDTCFRGSIKTEFDYATSVWAVAQVDAPDCIKSKAVAGTDIIFIKGTLKDPTEPVDIENTKTYIIADLDNAGHYLGTDLDLANKITAFGEYPDGEIWEYSYHAYYISKPAGVVFPQLRRMSLNKGGWVIETVADGIEDIHFEFGVDTANNDGAVDAYVPTQNVVDWDQVVSAKMYLLAQSTKSDMSYTDDKTYKYGDRDYTPSGTSSRYHRKLFETTVTLFNNQLERIKGL